MKAKDFLIAQTLSGGGGGGATDDRFARMIDGTIEDVTIPSDVTAIRTNAFDHCTGLKSVTGNGALATIGSYAFQNCTNLETADFSRSKFTSTNLYTFQSCTKLKTVKLPETLEEVGSSCFNNCTALEAIELPSATNSIAFRGFGSCSQLKSITLKNESQVVALGQNALSGVPADCIIKVPAGMVDTYKAASAWSSRADYIQAIE